MRSREAGADAIIVSNHGGRQLDGAPSTISVLPEIIEAVDGGLEVLIDSGFRRGADIVKALALGASGCAAGARLCVRARRGRGGREWRGSSATSRKRWTSRSG